MIHRSVPLELSLWLGSVALDETDYRTGGHDPSGVVPAIENALPQALQKDENRE